MFNKENCGPGFLVYVYLDSTQKGCLCKRTEWLGCSEHFCRLFKSVLFSLVTEMVLFFKDKDFTKILMGRSDSFEMLMDVSKHRFLHCTDFFSVLLDECEGFNTLFWAVVTIYFSSGYSTMLNTAETVPPDGQLRDKKKEAMSFSDMVYKKNWVRLQISSQTNQKMIIIFAHMSSFNLPSLIA